MSNLTNSIIAQILDMTPQGVGKWKKENRPIINLLDKYFTKEELEEFIDKNEIEKFKYLTSFTKDELAVIYENKQAVKDFIKILNGLKKEA